MVGQMKKVLRSFFHFSIGTEKTETPYHATVSLTRYIFLFFTFSKIWKMFSFLHINIQRLQKCLYDPKLYGFQGIQYV
jgi:hypothetical protein